MGVHLASWGKNVHPSLGSRMSQMPSASSALTSLFFVPCQCLVPSNGPTAFCQTLGISPLHLYTYKILQLHTVSIINYLHLCHSPAKPRHGPSCPPVPLVQEQERMHQDPQDPAPTNRPCCRSIFSTWTTAETNLEIHEQLDKLSIHTCLPLLVSQTTQGYHIRFFGILFLHTCRVIVGPKYQMSTLCEFA